MRRHRRTEPPDGFLYSRISYNPEVKTIVEKELDSCLRVMEAEEKLSTLIFAVVSVILLAAASIFSVQGTEIFAEISKRLGLYLSAAILILLLGLINAIFLIGLADKFKIIAYNCRKIVMIRMQMGLSYKDVDWIVPDNAVEGANNPFRIPIAPALFSFRMLPVHLLVLSVAVAVVSLLFKVDARKDVIMGCILAHVFLSYYILFIKMLEKHENKYFFFARGVARLLFFPVVFNFEHAIYHSWLAAQEIRRIKFDTSNINKMAIVLEDKKFFSHCGVDISAMARAAHSYLKRGKRSGASTITQQLVRSIFFEKLKPNFRRKIMEIILAIAINKSIGKSDTLEMYISSVRFDRGVIGFAAAVAHFFPLKLHMENQIVFSNAEAFFIIERLSNINQSIISLKICDQLMSLKNQAILNDGDIAEVCEILHSQIKEGRVIPRDEKALANIRNFFRLPDLSRQQEK